MSPQKAQGIKIWVLSVTCTILLSVTAFFLSRWDQRMDKFMDAQIEINSWIVKTFENYKVRIDNLEYNVKDNTANITTVREKMIEINSRQVYYQKFQPTNFLPEQRTNTNNKEPN